MSSQAQAHDGGQKSKRKPVRRDPEKRRQQNLQAQKRYREKLKERLARLETLDGPAALQGHTGGTANLATPPLSDPPGSPGLPGHVGSDAPDSVFYAAILGEGYDIKQPADDTSSAWDPTIHVDPFLLHRKRLGRPAGDDDDDDDDDSNPSCTAPLSCGCASTHASLQTRAGTPPLVLLRPRGSGQAADPYANHLRVEALCTIAALQAAGQLLGVTATDICARGATSPFARPGADAGAVATVRRLFGSLPRDLQPNTTQIAWPHHPVIDVLPFPTLRRNLIAAGAAVDVDGFFLDALVGLVCWGGGGGGGAPWDIRSWEARAWFLQKYWWLLGGEAGELARQSAQWRRARGEPSRVVDVGGGQQEAVVRPPLPCLTYFHLARR